MLYKKFLLKTLLGFLLPEGILIWREATKKPSGKAHFGSSSRMERVTSLGPPDVVNMLPMPLICPLLFLFAIAGNANINEVAFEIRLMAKNPGRYDELWKKGRGVPGDTSQADVKIKNKNKGSVWKTQKTPSDSMCFGCWGGDGKGRESHCP